MPWFRAKMAAAESGPHTKATGDPAKASGAMKVTPLPEAPQEPEDANAPGPAHRHMSTAATATLKKRFFPFMVFSFPSTVSSRTCPGPV